MLKKHKGGSLIEVLVALCILTIASVSFFHANRLCWRINHESDALNWLTNRLSEFSDRWAVTDGQRRRALISELEKHIAARLPNVKIRVAHYGEHPAIVVQGDSVWHEPLLDHTLILAD